ncbi:MAG: pyridoxal-phosphate dependent enzyme [Conexivisphaerales archaeon]
MWDYLPLFPFETDTKIISLGEGGTPLLLGSSFPSDSGLKNVLIKDETRNPTGSFKDRQTALYSNFARQHGFSTIIAMSSGNVAVSLSCHATANGLKSYEILPDLTPQEKILMIEAYGGIPVKTKITSSKTLYSITEEISKKFQFYNGITAAIYSPMNILGSKTIAYELYEAMKDHCNIFMASGGGGGVTALYHGAEEMLRMGLIDELPRIFSVQSSRCAPIFVAWRDNLGYSEIISKPFQNCISIATPLADDIPLDGFSAVTAINKTGGMVIAVSDSEILDAQKFLSRKTGIFPEPAGAASLAGFIRARDSGYIDPSEKSVIVVTGSGMKNLESIKNWTQETNDNENEELTKIKNLLVESALGQKSL